MVNTVSVIIMDTTHFLPIIILYIFVFHSIKRKAQLFRKMHLMREITQSQIQTLWEGDNL